MKKLMKKIKSNSFISKAVALLTICMVLMSSLTVSSFAADEEDVSSPTDSITDVWTSVMNWITTSLGSVQGVFYSSGESSFILDSSDIIETDYEGIPVFIVPVYNFSPDGVLEGSTYLFEFMGVSYSLVYSIDVDGNEDFYDINGAPFTLVRFVQMDDTLPPNPWILVLDEPFAGTATLVTPFTGSSSLTFLGTLAVIGVAIAIAFLLISVISRFLRLRG